MGTSAGEEWTIENSLSFLSNAFPEFLDQIHDSEILDFGCGLGYQVVGLAKLGARKVSGIEINPNWREKAISLGRLHGVSNNIEIEPCLGKHLVGRFDIVFSQSSFEHFSDPAAVIRQMHSALKPGGKLYITFYGPWYSPYGSHMQFFTGVPWVNLLFSEKTVMSVRSRFRNDGATRYEEVTSGLNRMSLAKFESIVAAEGMTVEYKKYRCIRICLF